MTSGDGIHHIDFFPYRFNPGTLLYIGQGRVHAFAFAPGTDGLTVLFTTRFLKENLIHSDIPFSSRLYTYHLYEPVLQPAEIKKEDFGSLFREIAWEYERRSFPDAKEILRLLLTVLLLKFERVKRTGAAGQSNAEWLVRCDPFREYLAKHYLSTGKVGDQADMPGRSPKHLNILEARRDHF